MSGNPINVHELNISVGGLKVKIQGYSIECHILQTNQRLFITSRHRNPQCIGLKRENTFFQKNLLEPPYWGN